MKKLEISNEILNLVGEEMASLWGATLESVEKVNENTFRFFANEHGEDLYFELTKDEIIAEFKKISDTK